MSKEVVAKNCKITNLPSGWSAKTNNNGTCVLKVPFNDAGMFGGKITCGSINSNGFSAQAFDGQNKLTLIGDTPVDFDISSFTDV